MRIEEYRFRLQKETKKTFNTDIFKHSYLKYNAVGFILSFILNLLSNQSNSDLSGSEIAILPQKMNKIPFQVTKRGQNEKWI